MGAKSLSNVRSLGRYRNIETGKEYNIKKGTNRQRGTDSIFYLYRGNKVFVSDKDFYSIYKKISEHDIDITINRAYSLDI
jgi:hypothetical protein